LASWILLLIVWGVGLMVWAIYIVACAFFLFGGFSRGDAGP